MLTSLFVTSLLGLDAAFLYLENSRSPMHIGALALMEGTTPRGAFTFERFRRRIAQRLPRVPILRQRLAKDPTGLASPSWVDDEDFSLDHHLHHTTLAEPAGWAQLTSLMAHEIARPLAREHPLWEILFVEGLGELPGVPPGAVALITKMHHAAVDGVSGAEVLGALFDLTPKASDDTPIAAWKPDDTPTDLDLLFSAGRRAAGKPLALAKTVGRTLKGLAGSGALWALGRVELPPSPFTAPRTRLNGPISGQRVWDAVSLPLDRLRALRRHLSGIAPDGVTINDLVLGICSGALRRYLAEYDDLPTDPLVAMAPISVRGRDENEALGNRVSAMLVPLATHEPDSLERLRSIHRDSVSSKAYHRAIGADTLTDYTQFVPFSVAALAARLYTGMGAARFHRPPFNLVITNVPGPQVPLYLGGSRMLTHFGTAPLFDGLGVLLAVFSYDGSLGIGITACRRTLPDVDRFALYLRQSFEDLEEAAASLSSDSPTATPEDS
ncbi:MAG: wax ester/triacylglycerol synthase family O-acyltransferase [Acidobacteriota bacterium]